MLARAQTLEEVDVDGSVTVFDAATGRALVLNATASDVWRATTRAATLDGITAIVAAAYGLSSESIRPEVAATVAELRRLGLLLD